MGSAGVHFNYNLVVFEEIEESQRQVNVAPHPVLFLN